MLAWPGQAQEHLPIFDTHVHYSQPAWQPYNAKAIMTLFESAGVERALVSSTPDDGTLTLYHEDSSRVAPSLRPYRGDIGLGNWVGDPGLLPYLTQRLEAGIYRGIGEFHLHSAGDAQTPSIRRVVALAVARDIVLHVHSGADPVHALFAIDPKVKIFWAHAGMSEPPQVVGELMDRYPQLWTDLSFRAHGIVRDGGIDPAWAGVFRRHCDRFTIGTDTYTTGRWEGYRDLIAEHRRWLAHLPANLAEAIAWRNAVRLFGDGGRPRLRQSGAGGDCRPTVELK
jgi:hypothetical protein